MQETKKFVVSADRGERVSFMADRAGHAVVGVGRAQMALVAVARGARVGGRGNRRRSQMARCPAMADRAAGLADGLVTTVAMIRYPAAPCAGEVVPRLRVLVATHAEVLLVAGHASLALDTDAEAVPDLAEELGVVLRLLHLVTAVAVPL